MRDIPSQILTQQHRDIDALFASVTPQTLDKPQLQAALADLRLHIYVEEALLFPLVNRGLAMPIGVMRDEHGQMWRLMDQLQVACEHDTALSPADFRAISDLFDLLQLHNPKEEGIIYAALDDFHANDFEPGSIVEDICEAKLPVGWVCERAGDLL